MPAGHDLKNSGRSLKLSLDDWDSLGIRKPNGNRVSGSTKAALVVIDEDPESAYLVFSNFDVIMDWNRSVYFATTVGMLAEKIKIDRWKANECGENSTGSASAIRHYGLW